MDSLAVITCKDGWSTLDKFENFLQAKNKKVKAPKVLKIPGSVQNLRTAGDYVHFSLPDFSHSYKVY